MNRIQIIGRLTANPELKSTKSGVQVCTFNVAVGRRFDKEETDFFPVIVWRDAAVHCNKYLTKGSQVAISDSLQIRRYDDKDGKKCTTVDLQADEVEFLSYKNEASDNKSAQKQAEPKQTTMDEFEPVDDDDMPF